MSDSLACEVGNNRERDIVDSCQQFGDFHCNKIALPPQVVLALITNHVPTCEFCLNLLTNSSAGWLKVAAQGGNDMSFYR